MIASQAAAHTPANPKTAAPAITPRDDITLLGCGAVVARTSISRAGVYRMVSAGAFPRPVRVHRVRVAWIKSEVDAWIAQRVAQRDAGVAP